MCKAVEYSKVLENVYSSIIESYNSLTKQVTAFDRMQQDILHHIENDEFTELEMIDCFLKLKSLRKERRVIKNEQQLMVTLCTDIRPIRRLNQVKRVKEKLIDEEDIKVKRWVYYYRTDICKQRCTALITRPKFDLVIINN